MSKIYFPGSLCPLHLWHEEFINTIQNKIWKEIYFSIKSWDKILEEMKKLNKNWKLNHLIIKLKEKNNFLSLEEISYIIKEIYPNSTIGNDTRDEIIWDDFDGIVIWSDNFNLIVNSIKNWKRKFIKFKKIYLYERIWHPILEYKKLFKEKQINVEVIFLWKGKYDISSSNIVKEYNDWWIKKINKLVSKNVFNLIDYIKNKNWK